jgi:death-on-curing protein
MRYLSAEQVLFIHARLIAETGGEHGVRDIGLLQSAIARPKATFDKEDLYKGVVQKAAALLESLINNHPFIDGNKRTGITAAMLFLKINGFSFSTSNEELESFTLSVANGGQNIDTISQWILDHQTS